MPEHEEILRLRERAHKFATRLTTLEFRLDAAEKRLDRIERRPSSLWRWVFASGGFVVAVLTATTLVWELAAK